MTERNNIANSDGFHLHFSSTDALSGTSSDFTIACSIPSPPNGLDFNRIAAVDIAIPKSWYLVTAPYNTFKLVENGTSVTVTIPAGNYSYPQWVSQVPAIITTASPNRWVYTAIMVNTPSLGVVSYTVTGSGGLQPSFVVNTTGDLSQQLGFPSGTWTFVGNVLQGTIPYNATGEFGIRLRSDICESEGDSTLADIMDVGLSGPGSIIRFQLQECLAQTKRFHRTGSTAFRFWLVSATTGRPINTNGLPIIIHLKIYRLEDNAIWVDKQILSQLQLMTASIESLKEQLRVQQEVKAPPPLPVEAPPLPETPPPPPQVVDGEPPHDDEQEVIAPPTNINVREGEPQENGGGRKLSDGDDEEYGFV